MDDLEEKTLVIRMARQLVFLLTSQPDVAPFTPGQRKLYFYGGMLPELDDDHYMRLDRRAVEYATIYRKIARAGKS